MFDSTVWLQHLSSSLRANRQVAYLYHVEDDKFEFLGDILGVLGIAEDDIPKNKDEFKKLILGEDLVSRQIEMSDAIQKSKSQEKNFTMRYRMVRMDGSDVPVIETGIARYDTKTMKTTVQSLLAVDVETIQSRKRLARKMGFRNAVTTVFSSSEGRRNLLESLESSIELQDNGKGFLLLAGLDRISLVNEIYGSSFTDELINEVDKTISKVIGSKAKMYRVSGDIFGILFEDSDPGEMHAIAQNILSIFYNQTFDVQGRSIHQVISIGGVRYKGQELTPASILSRAELALMDAKNRGRGCFIEYSEKLGEQVQNFKEILSTGDSFLRGFKDGRVKMAFQGIVSSRTNDVTFHECLIRLIDENGEVHSAGRFIEAIEKMGLTRLVDTFATREAIRELKSYPEISLSVNVSNNTFTDPDWLKGVTAELRDFPDVARRLIVEITESVAMSDVNQTLRVVRALQDIGCRIALDDFGVGQTAFSQLKDLSLDIVKIDKSFVREMAKEENKLFIRTLHSLASAMQLETVGEGAETIEESEALARDGIDHIQGFVHGMPTMDRPWADAKLTKQ